MIATHNTKSNKRVWYLLSKKEYNTHKLDEFIENGYWEYYEDKVERENERKIYRNYLHEVQKEDKVAIYSLYGQDRDKFGQIHNYRIKRTKVTYILIRAVGKITCPCDDNKKFGIDCQKVNDFRKWYHHTYPGPIWRVIPEDKVPWRRNLIDFTFNEAEQNLAELKAALAK